MTETLLLTTADGETLEAERTDAIGPVRAQIVLCHPHPQHGGTMQSLVTSELFRQLPDHGLTCLRFNFRGVGRSTGSFRDGIGERLDVLAALDTVTSARSSGSTHPPTFIVGWSFGADLALSTIDPRVGGWVAIALPLHWLANPAAIRADPRPKLLLLADHDEFRPAEQVVAAASDWAATDTEIISGASHFFVGRTDVLVRHVAGWITTHAP